MSCWYCGGRTTRPRRDARDTDATVEHLVPLSAGGSDDWANRVKSCRRCNSFAGSWSVEVKQEFRRLMGEGGPDPRDRDRREVEMELLRRINDRKGVGRCP